MRSLLARMHKNAVVVALANELARIAWAVLRKGTRGSPSWPRQQPNRPDTLMQTDQISSKTLLATGRAIRCLNRTLSPPVSRTGAELHAFRPPIARFVRVASAPAAARAPQAGDDSTKHINGTGSSRRDKRGYRAISRAHLSGPMAVLGRSVAARTAAGCSGLLGPRYGQSRSRRLRSRRCSRTTPTLRAPAPGCVNHGRAARSPSDAAGAHAVLPSSRLTQLRGFVWPEARN